MSSSSPRSATAAAATTTTTTTAKPAGPPPPKKIGIMVVGLGGNNGVTMLAGKMANQYELEWESSACGKVSAPNWNGCITQLDPSKSERGVGFKGRYNLADATTAAVIGGWDIRPTPLGDALYESRVLDYDLVRQVRNQMNKIEILKGIYNPSFVGESQHATATHIVEDATTFFEKVQHLRKDIRDFIQTNEIDGHTTVIWSASVERPSKVKFLSAKGLLETIIDPESNQLTKDISPSMLYSIASAMEGCSFVNGGSQNTLSPGMNELFEYNYRTKSASADLFAKFGSVSFNPAYLLGTDFKAGQTKFKTAAVEYIRALGLKPRVIASSNHLGNNDMLNLTSKKTVDAKMRVKSNIFGPWNETDLDHQVKVMYTPFMLDEKRDVVEYTSLGFLNSPHTMLTYTRCMDSILCVPLMVDASVWCDYFSRCDSDSSLVAKATAYLFKVPEGNAKNVDPGFHKQMSVLESSLRETTSGIVDVNDLELILEKGILAGIITQAQADSLKGLN